jgi:hypothetical protein
LLLLLLLLLLSLLLQLGFTLSLYYLAVWVGCRLATPMN